MRQNPARNIKFGILTNFQMENTHLDSAFEVTPIWRHWPPLGLKIGEKRKQFWHIIALWQKHKIWYSDQLSGGQHKSGLSFWKLSNLWPQYDVIDHHWDWRLGIGLNSSNIWWNFGRNKIWYRKQLSGGHFSVPGVTDGVLLGSQISNFSKTESRSVFSTWKLITIPNFMFLPKFFHMLELLTLFPNFQS